MPTRLLPSTRITKQTIQSNIKNNVQSILNSIFNGEFNPYDSNVQLNGCDSNGQLNGCDSNVQLNGCDSNVQLNGFTYNGENINFYIVCQGKTYEYESTRGHLFAALKSHPAMVQVKRYDVIFSYVSGFITSINVALQSARKTYGTLDNCYRIDCFYNELNIPLDVEPLRKNLMGVSPFNINGDIQPSYIHQLDKQLAFLFIKEIIKLGNKPRKL